MPSKSPTDKILPQLADWQLADLKDLQAALAGLVEALEATQEDTFMTPDATTEGVIKQSPGRKQARGHIEAKYIPRGHKQHGPYLYLRYWQGGKLRSKYLGKAKQQDS